MDHLCSIVHFMFSYQYTYRTDVHVQTGFALVLILMCGNSNGLLV